MAQSLEDQVSRLQAMREPGQQTWDLSPKDTEAIALAVRVLSVIQKAGEQDEWLETFSYDTDDDALKDFDEDEKQDLRSSPVSLRIGIKECRRATLLECFSDAGELLA